MAYVSVDVDVDLYDFSDEDLITEIKQRGFEVNELSDNEDDQTLITAFKLKKHDVVLDLIRTRLMNKHGIVL